MGAQRISTAEMLGVTRFTPSLWVMSNQRSKADELCPAHLLPPRSWKAGDDGGYAVITALAQLCMHMVPKWCCNYEEVMLLWYLGTYSTVGMFCSAAKGQRQKTLCTGERDPGLSPMVGIGLKQDVPYTRG